MDNTLIRKTQVDAYVSQNEIEHKELKIMVEKVSDSTKTQWYSIAVLYGGLAVLSFLIGRGLIKGL